MKHDQRAKILPFPASPRPSVADHVAEVTPRERASWWGRWGWVVMLLSMIAGAIAAVVGALGVL